MIYLVCVGNLKEKYLELACSEYSKRISRYSQIKIIECKESIVNNINVALKNEAQDIIKSCKGYVIKLAINGEQLSSEQLAKKIENITVNGYSDITFIIGSSYGLDENIKADFSLSISKMTFPHQLARVILLEQIYRAFTILNNTPYHK